MSPISDYYKGSGSSVMRDLKDEYGEEGGERAFYAIANKRGMKPPGENRPKRRIKRGGARS